MCHDLCHDMRHDVRHNLLDASDVREQLRYVLRNFLFQLQLQRADLHHHLRFPLQHHLLLFFPLRVNVQYDVRDDVRDDLRLRQSAVLRRVSSRRIRRTAQACAEPARRVSAGSIWVGADGR